MTTESMTRVARGALALALVGSVSCGGNGDGGGSDTNVLGIEVCDPAAGPFSTEVTHPFFPLPVGRQLVLEGEEDGEDLLVVITVLAETEVVAGVPTRVVEENESVDGEVVEISRNFFAQAPDGTVCYFGEDVTDFEDGVPVPADDQWRAGVAGALPGIIMPAAPMVGDRYAQEIAPGVAEDRAEIVSLGDSVTVPAGTFTDTLTTLEENPLEPDDEPSTKVYASGIGLIVDDSIRLTSVD